MQDDLDFAILHALRAAAPLHVEAQSICFAANAAWRHTQHASMASRRRRGMLQLLLATAMRSAEPFQRASGAVPPRARVAPLRALDSFMLGRLDEMRVTFEEMTARLARRPRGDAVEAFDGQKDQVRGGHRCTSSVLAQKSAKSGKAASRSPPQRAPRSQWVAAPPRPRRGEAARHRCALSVLVQKIS